MKMYVPAEGEMCNVHHDLDCCGRKFNRLDPHTKGIAEGLRMAAEMIGGIYKCEGVKKLILAKAKEFEEAKGGN